MILIHESWQAAAKSEGMKNHMTKWDFLPPLSPHMGGLHEAAVKSTKHHLRRVIGAQQLTYEELATLLTQVEACLNSRPILALTEDANDSLALTPGHFLIGEPLVGPIMKDYSCTKSNSLTRFKLMNKMAQEFWSRWSEEYVSSLMRRNKWHQSQPNLKVNDIVLIVSEALPPTQWPLARVTAVHPGDDGQVRVVDVISNEHTYRRPVTKLCKLPTTEPPGGEDVQNEQN
ncbi:MAG: hypothetical protein EOP45_07755 [Sphingobacteriaceae bacterium]|nr:MAG: hypothetical protein EOP45_07755 [Sphingobacteriaceae bacterium]